jgi:16S rRNA (guanine527-N7)-methyltransferase
MVTESDSAIFLQSLKEEAERLGLQILERALPQLAAYYELLARWNRRIRLVGSAEPRRAAVDLFADSLIAGAFCGASRAHGAAPRAGVVETEEVAPRMIDIGSGAGFPGFVLKIQNPERELTAVEPDAKKHAFLKTLQRELGLEEVRIERARAEELARNPRFAQTFDLAFCRAVAPPLAAIRLAVPFLRSGGSFILQVGALPEKEVSKIAKAAEEMGATLCESRTYTLSFPSGTRLLLQVKKNVCHDVSSIRSPSDQTPQE